MLEPKAFGFPVGRRLKSRDRDSQIFTIADETAYWFSFSLPAPENVKAEHDSTTSCLIMMLLFLIAPQLKRIPAFNLGGKGWKRKKTVVRGKRVRRRVDGAGYPQGELKVGFTQSASGKDRLMLASIIVANVVTQNKLREKFFLRNGDQHYAAVPASFKPHTLTL